MLYVVKPLSSENKSKEFVKHEAKAISKYTIIAVMAMLFIGGLGMVGTGLGVKSIDVGAFKTFGQAWATLNVATIVWLCFSFIAIGGTVLLWAKVSHFIGLHLKDKKEETQETIQLRKIRIIPVFIFGAFSSMIIFAVLRFAVEITGINASDPIALFSAFTSGNAITVFSTVATLTCVGFVIYHLRKVYTMIENYVPKKLERV